MPLTSASFSAWDQTLNRIVNGGAGRDFSWDSSSAVNDWDKLIWDLLDYTYKCTMPSGVVVSGTSTGDRGAGTLLTLPEALDTTDGKGPGDDPPAGEGPEDSWGIPVIHLIRDGH